MKCEKCGNNEATFHYQSIINGQKSEFHLCNDCAKEAGLSESFAHAFQPAAGSFFGDSFGLGQSFFGSPFGLAPRFLGGRGFDSWMSPMMGFAASPWAQFFVGEGSPSTKTSEENSDNIPEDAGDEIKSKRALCALKAELKKAVKAEEFEKAAELRDKIREMER